MQQNAPEQDAGPESPAKEPGTSGRSFWILLAYGAVAALAAVVLAARKGLGDR